MTASKTFNRQCYYRVTTFKLHTIIKACAQKAYALKSVRSKKRALKKACIKRRAIKKATL